MVDSTNLKIYKTTNNLGGAITATEVISSTPLNLFTNVPRNEQVIGEDYYACVWLKNTHGSEKMASFKWWLSSKSFPHDTEIKWGFDPNLTTPQTIADKYTAPTGVTWRSVETVSTSFNNGDLDPGESIPIWLWLHVSANAIARLDDNAIFTSNLNIPQGGTGSGGGTGGGGGGVPGTYHYDPYHTFSSERITVPDAPALRLLTFSCSVWFRTSHNYTSQEGMMLIKGIGSDPATPGHFINYNLKLNNDPYNNELECNSLSNDGTYHAVFTEGETWNDGQWHHAVVTYDHVNEKLYCDGELKMTLGTVFTPDTGNNDLCIGAEDPGGDNPKYWFGELDEIRVWNVGLTQTEVEELHQSGTVPQTGAIVYENLFGGSGSGSGGGSGGTGGNPPPVNTDYKVAIAGDWGCEPETDDVIDLIQTQGYDFVVGVGDNAYEAAGCWTTRFAPLKPNFNSGYGNHEYSETGGVTPYKTFFGHSLTYFSFQFENIFFIVGDTNIDIDPGSNQHNFITSECARVLNDSTVTWRVFIDHHPWWTASSDHPSNEFNQVESLHALLQNNKFNFVCTGHNHNWQRTFQVSYNAGSPTNPTIVDSTSPYSRTAIGVIHVVTGTGGHDTGSSLYALGSQPGFQAYQNRTHNGVWEIVASNNAQTLTCQFREIGGDVFDTFVIA